MNKNKDRLKLSGTTKITLKETIAPTLHVIKCPKCGDYAASASEFSILPNWATCRSCDY